MHSRYPPKSNTVEGYARISLAHTNGERDGPKCTHMHTQQYQRQRQHQQQPKPWKGVCEVQVRDDTLLIRKIEWMDA